jgi:pimeloyl-ACP methyl ester carboxylesterase
MARQVVTAPPLVLQALERLAALEFPVLLAGSPLLGLAPNGHGDPVLVVPGFAGSDQSTETLRRFLRWKGHAVYGWGLGHNVGPHERVVARLRRRLEILSLRHETTVSIVGMSLGGVYARELARQHAPAVRQVVTLGSPFRLRTGDRTSVSWLYDLVGPRDDPMFTQPPPEDDRPRLPVPATAIFTRTDGVVRWQACVEREGPRHENVEVRGTHAGLGFNLAAIYAVLDRLAQSECVWQEFQPPAALRHLYGPVRPAATVA